MKIEIGKKYLFNNKGNSGDPAHGKVVTVIEQYEDIPDVWRVTLPGPLGVGVVYTEELSELDN